MIKEIKDNHLFWDGCDTVALAKEFGTPLYVFSVTEIRTQCRAIREEFLSRYENTRAAYASKAFNTLAMLRLIDEEGLSLDVLVAVNYTQPSKQDFQRNKSNSMATINLLMNWH